MPLPADRAADPFSMVGKPLPTSFNRDVPQEVVRRILDDSAEMTAHYARLHDTTVRRHWERARKVAITVQPVTLDPAGPLADAAWAKQRLGRITQALPNGYCGLPVQKTCPHANACLTCPMFITTAEFHKNTVRNAAAQLTSPNSHRAPDNPGAADAAGPPCRRGRHAPAAVRRGPQSAGRCVIG